MKSFCRNHLREIVFIWLLLFLTYAIRIFCPTISVDTEILVTDPSANDPGWIGRGRWALVLIGKIFRPDYFNIYAANMTAVLFFGTAVILFGYMLSGYFDREGEQKAAMLIPAALIITSPCYAEQFGFTLQAAEVAFSMLLMMISLFLLNRFLYEKKRGCGAASVLLLTFVFGTYQAFYPLWICLASFLYAVEIIRKDHFKETSRNLLLIVKYAIVFITAALMTWVIRCVLTAALRIHETSGYMDAMVGWGKFPVKECLMNIIRYAYRVAFNPDYFRFFGFAAVASAVLFVICFVALIRRHGSYAVLPSLALLITVSSFFLLAVATGSGQVLVRTQLALCPALACFALLFLDLFPGRVPGIAVGVLCAVITLIQWKNTSGLFLSDYFRYNEDIRYTAEIMNRIDEKNDSGILRKDLKLAFVGNHEPESTAIVLKGETLGQSFYHWDVENPYASSGRIYSFCQTQGYRFQMPSVEEYSAAQDYAERMNTFPGADSIAFYGDLVVIRLC
jgi:hypothetical protein